MTPENKRLPRQNTSKKLAWLDPPFGILKIEGKKQKRPPSPAAFSVFAFSHRLFPAAG
jgi:hypothetical protein